LNVRLGEGVGRKHFQQAGTDGQRAADLQAAINDPTVKAIWCARGGYGTVRLMDRIDLRPLARHPKWIVGFSDITVLHNALHRLGVASLHAQMPHNLAAKTEATRETLRAALFGEAYSIEATSFEPRAASLTPGTELEARGSRLEARAGQCEGVLLGGNLSMLYALRGTPYDIDPTDKILFLEDLDELLYHVDRMVQNLRLGGWFAGLRGLVVGGMSEMHDRNPADPFGQSAEAIIAEAVAPFSYPVCYGFPAGHIADNRALVFGQKAKLSVTPESATLSFDGIVRPSGAGESRGEA
jgi:muramoyltetrapeptide carboxypeptidase